MHNKRIAVLFLTAVMLTTQTAWASENGEAANQIVVVRNNGTTITRDELEELKKKLQDEIDHYWDYVEEEDDWIDVLFETAKNYANVGAGNKNAANEIAEEYEILDEVYEQEVMPVFADSASENGMGLWGDFNTEEYTPVKEKGFFHVWDDPLSTFAADVDTGSYCNLRRMLKDGYSWEDIPSGSIRTEELLNYFDYQIDDENRSDGAFSVQYETAVCPWNSAHDLLLMTIEANTGAYERTDDESANVQDAQQGSNFVYLLDTSGSMDEPEKIGLAKCALKLLAYTMTEKDTISIVTYSGDSYTALEGCPGNDYEKICETLDSVVPYGGTNGSGGITRAYELAEKYFAEDGNNRVIIASDGDMNLGITDTSGLVDLIRKEKETGVFLTVLGFGSGNYSDTNMEQIADAGNGNYHYIDCLDEAQHVLVEKLRQTTITAAKDVKFQAEFNPGMITDYRLIGYENREVANHDFQNDAVDGGEVGQGQQVTVLYEIQRGREPAPEGTMRYQAGKYLTKAADSNEILTLSINYKDPAEDTSVTESYQIPYEVSENDEMSADMNLAVSLAELSMLLHNSSYMGDSSMEAVREFAAKADQEGNLYRLGYQLMLMEE